MNDILYMRYRALIIQILTQYLRTRGDLYAKSVVDAAGLPQDIESVLMSLCTELSGNAGGVPSELQSILMQLVGGDAVLTADGVPTTPQSTLMQLVGGDAALTADVALHRPEDALLDARVKLASEAVTKVQLSEAVLMLAMTIMQSAADARATGAENRRGDVAVKVMTAGAPAAERVRDVLMQSISRFCSSASGTSYGIVHSSGADDTTVLMDAGGDAARVLHIAGTLGAALMDAAGHAAGVQRAAGLLEAVCSCIAAATAVAVVSGPGDLLTEMLADASGMSQLLTDVDMHITAETQSAAGATHHEAESILLSALADVLLEAGATTQEVSNVLVSAASALACAASGRPVEPKKARMDAGVDASGSASAFTLGLPYQRGNVLRIPSAYSATLRGNVLVVR